MKTENFETAYKEVGNRLKLLRSRKGFSTSEEFAMKYDLPTVQYCKMENGKGNLTLKSLLKVLMIYEMSLDDFFCYDLKKAAA